jgi:hypothetical protein
MRFYQYIIETENKNIDKTNQIIDNFILVLEQLKRFRLE